MNQVGWSEGYTLENCALLGHYAASSGHFLPKFRDELSVPSSGIKIPDKSYGTHQSKCRNNAELLNDAHGTYRQAHPSTLIR
jgi:hypothetical protein